MKRWHGVHRFLLIIAFCPPLHSIPLRNKADSLAGEDYQLAHIALSRIAGIIWLILRLVCAFYITPLTKEFA